MGGAGAASATALVASLATGPTRDLRPRDIYFFTGSIFFVSLAAGFSNSYVLIRPALTHNRKQESGWPFFSAASVDFTSKVTPCRMRYSIDITLPRTWFTLAPSASTFETTVLIPCSCQ